MNTQKITKAKVVEKIDPSLIVQKKLWNYGYKVNKVKLQPYDLIVEEKFKVRVVSVVNKKAVGLPKKNEFKLIDVIAGVVDILPGKPVVFFTTREMFKNSTGAEDLMEKSLPTSLKPYLVFGKPKK